MKFDENLRNLRKEKDYSQEYLAEKMGVTRQTISKWENGTAMPDLKKLTELADLFEISMDSLLGMEYDSENPQEDTGESNVDYSKANEYTNNLINSVRENVTAESHKKFVIFTVSAVLILIILFIFLSSSFSNVKNRLSNIENSCSNLINQIGYLNYNDETNYNDDYYYEDISINTVSIDENNPLLLELEFKYAPTSYPKGTMVYFLIPQSDGNTEKLPAEEKNGEFVLTTVVDISLNKPYFVIIDDCENIVKNSFEFNIQDCYGFVETTWYGVDFEYIITKVANENSYIFSPQIDEQTIKWESGLSESKLNSIKLIVENDGKAVYSKELELSNEEYSELFSYKDSIPVYTDDNYDKQIYLSYYDLPIFTIENFTPSNLAIYVQAESDNGITYKYHLSFSDSNYDTTLYESECYLEMIFNSKDENGDYRSVRIEY